MITRRIARDEVEAVLADGGNFTKVGLSVFAENFFEYGYQNNRKQFYKDEMEELLSNLEFNARDNGNEECGAVMGKAVLLTFKRRQVVVDALSYLSRAAEKGIKGAAVELCAWYAGRIIADDLANFPDADVGLDDCYDPTPDFPRLTFPKSTAECRRRLVQWLGKTSKEDFDDVKECFASLSGSKFDVPHSWEESMSRLSVFLDGTGERFRRAKELIEGASGEGASKQIAEGAKIIRDLAENADSLDAWKYMLACHERGLGPFKTNKFRRAAKEAIARLEGR